MDYTSWSSKELAQKLTELGFGQYSRNFRVNDLKGSHLPLLTEEHLKEMGITKVGHRVLLMKRISEIVNGSNPKPANLSENSRPSSNSSQSQQTESDHQPTSARIPARVARRQMYQDQQEDEEERVSSQQQRRAPSSMEDGMSSQTRYAASATNRQREEKPKMSQSPSAELVMDGDKAVCPYCGRRLPPDQAKRHIPVCAKIRGGAMRK